MLSLMLLMAAASEPFPYAKEEAELSVGINEHELKAHVYRLAGPEFLGRKGEGGDRAAEHIAAMFAKLPLKPAFGDSYFQNIPWRLTTPRSDGKNYVGRNVGAYLPGSDPALADEWIVLAAHFDHLGIRNGKLYPGADDNASGVAMLLEVAEAFALANVKPKRSIYFISFDLEETLLQGSSYFVDHPPRDYRKLKAFLVADLLGRSMGGVMNEYLFVLGSETSPELTALTKTTPPEAGLTLGRLGADLVGTRSDYGPFRDRKTPFLFFTTGVHRDYHEPTDLPDRIDYAKLTKASRWIESITRKIADTAEAPHWAPDPLGPGRDELNTVRVLFDRTLAQSKDKAMKPGQRERLEAARDHLNKINESGRITAEDRTWLRTTAQWALLNIF